jgi:outer membrane protein assembly factor BamB
VYVLGAVGHLHCLKADSGEVIWQKHLPTDFGTKLPTWGMAAAPLVEGDQLIVLVGGEKNALVVSFDKHTGRELWRQLDDPAVGYSPPVVLEYAGQRQLIVWHASAISALDPASGAILWQYPHQVREALAIMTPRKVGERGLFVSSFYQGPIMLDLGADGKTPTLKWDNAGRNELTNQSIHTIMPTPIVGPDWLAGVSSYGQLRCVDAATGKLLWETRQPTGEGRWWNAFLVPNAPDGEPIGKKVFLTNEQGDLIIASISREGYRELSRGKLIEPTQPIQRRMTAWSHPAYAMQSIFARNDKELIRVNLAK